MTSTGDRGKKRRRQEKAGEDRQKTGRRADKYLRICCDRSSHDSCQNSGQDNSSSGAARPRRLASRDASRIPRSATIVDFHGIAEHCQAKRSYKKAHLLPRADGLQGQLNAASFCCTTTAEKRSDALNRKLAILLRKACSLRVMARVLEATAPFL